MSAKNTVAVIGLGAMGLPMAKNLVAAGWDVIGVDINPASLKALEAAGGRIARSPAEAARETHVVVLMVVNGDQAEMVLFGENGAAAMMGKGPGGEGSLVIACCTQPPAQAASTARRLADMGIAMLDAPVSGGVAGATAGKLSIMASGAQGDWDRALPMMQVVGERLYHVGTELGQGSTVKMVNQLLCGVHIAAAAEAMVMGAQAGIDPAMMLEVYGNSAAASWMLRDRGPRMLQEEPPVSSAVDIFVKDLGIVTDHGKRVRYPTPIASAALQMFLGASALGHGKEDDSGVAKAYEALSGVKLPRKA